MTSAVVGPDPADPFQETVGFRTGVAGIGELRQQVLLLFRQICRRFHLNLDDLVAAGVPAQYRHALAAHPEAPARLCARLDGQARKAPLDGRNLDRPAKGGGGHRHRYPAHDVSTIPVKNRMRIDRDENIEIARRPTAQSGFTLARQPDSRSRIDTGRNRHRQDLVLHHPAFAAA